MIAPLRRRHRAMVAVLAVLLPVGYATALLARPTFPVAPAPQTEPAAGVLAERPIQLDLPGSYVRVRTWRAGGERFVELAPRIDLEQPDVLVYALDEGRYHGSSFVGDASLDPSALSEAYLLGTLQGRASVQYRLPAELEGAPFRLILYSLARHEVVGLIEGE